MAYIIHKGLAYNNKVKGKGAILHWYSTPFYSFISPDLQVKSVSLSVQCRTYGYLPIRYQIILLDDMGTTV